MSNIVITFIVVDVLSFIGLSVIINSQRKTIRKLREARKHWMMAAQNYERKALHVTGQYESLALSIKRKNSAENL